MTVISVFSKLKFGPGEGTDHIVAASLEAPLSEDFGEKYLGGRPADREEEVTPPAADHPSHPSHHRRHHHTLHPVHANQGHEKHSEHDQAGRIASHDVTQARQRDRVVTPPPRHGDRVATPTTLPSRHEVTPAPLARPHDVTPHERAASRGAVSANFTKENADAVRATAKRLGISPKDLSTVIGYETIGSYSPSKRGLAGHTGLIQFGRGEQAKYGVHPGQTFAEQMPAVERYLKDRGVKPGMGIKDVYSTVLAGSPGRYNARDIGGSVSEHVARMQRDRSAAAERFLESGSDHLSQKRLLGGGSAPGPEGQIPAVGGAPASAFIMHHTGGGRTVQDIQNTLRARCLGVQYIMDREGNIHQTGGPGEHQIMRGHGKGAGLSSANTVGMEIIARDDRDVTRRQVEAAKAFIRKNYPTTPVFGHGEVNPGHKQATEGLTVTEAIRAERAARAARVP